MLSSLWKAFFHSFCLPVLFVSVLGCGDSSPSPASGPTRDQVGARESWTLAESPLVEIGVREGEEAYQLHRALSSVRLNDGRIVIANAGSRELRFFGPDGQFLRSVGGDGEGPGEFRFPSRIRRAGKDSLLAWDQRLQRASFFGSDGEFLGSETLFPTSAVMFPGDEWLVGRFWVDSPVSPSSREPIRQAIEAIPLPDSLQDLLYLKVTPQGRIWASEVRPPADTVLHWTVYDMEGQPLADVTTPPRFEPHDIGESYILGGFRDEMDINFIRLVTLQKPEGSPGGSGLDLSRAPGDPRSRPIRSLEEEAKLAPLKDLLKNLASLQEINYANGYTYTSDLETLFADPRARVPDGLSAVILFAGQEGWMGTVTDLSSGAYCALAYGLHVPMGWAPGMVICP